MISLNDFRRLVRPIFNKLFLIIGKGTVETTNPGTTPGKSNQIIKATFLRDETLGNVPHLQPYGFESRSLPGAEALGAFINGNRDQGVIVIIADRRHRPITLLEGEVVIYNAFGVSITLTATGKVAIIAPGGFSVNGVPIP